MHCASGNLYRGRSVKAFTDRVLIAGIPPVKNINQSEAELTNLCSLIGGERVIFDGL